MSTAAAVPLRFVRRSPAVIGVSARGVVVRTATTDDAAAIDALIREHLQEGHLLPRDIAEITLHANRFVVAVKPGRVLACAELAPLSGDVAEVRSLVVSTEARSTGLGKRLVEELIRRAEAAGFARLCAFTHSPRYFMHLGFSIVPHVWLPEKIATDCHGCVHFRQCGQYAVMHTLAPAAHGCVPLAALHG